MVCDLNRLYVNEPALHEGDVVAEGFQWLVGDDHTNCVIAYLRQTPDQRETILVISNLTPSPRDNYRLGAPCMGYYKEIFNSDADWYGGAGLGNQGGVYSKETPSHGKPASIVITVPPLATVMFKAVPPPVAVPAAKVSKTAGETPV